MRNRLCVDFGTSTIRAALYCAHDGRRVVLPLAKALRLTASDEASLLSQICLAGNRKTVFFGEKALLERVADPSRTVSFSSPKLWLKEPAEIDAPLVADSPLTRAQLLSGLLAYAFSASKVAATYLGHREALVECDLRIAHPVWPKSIEKRANHCLLYTSPSPRDS